MAIFYDEYLNEGSKEDRAAMRLMRSDAKKGYKNALEDLAINRGDMGNHEYRLAKKNLKNQAYEGVATLKDAIDARKKQERKDRIEERNARHYANIINKKERRDAKQNVKDLIAKQKRARDEELASKAFGEACDYISGCLNEEYEIDIDLLKESCEYVLDTLDEYDEY